MIDYIDWLVGWLIDGQMGKLTDEKMGELNAGWVFGQWLRDQHVRQPSRYRTVDGSTF